MVAHIDTVRRDELDIDHLYIDGNIFTANGILGADDRAGVAALIVMMKRFGDQHSYLFTDMEECGGWGAEAAANDMTDELSQHCYAIEPDRFGDSQCVFYDGTDGDDFEEYLIDNMNDDTCFGWGSYTDIATICPEVGICGMNISIGYINQHTGHEVLFYDAWLRGVENIVHLLNRSNIPKFMPNPPMMQMGYHGYEYSLGKNGDSKEIIQIGKFEEESLIEPAGKPDSNGNYWHIYDDGYVPVVNAAGDIIDYLDYAHMDDQDWMAVDEHGALNEKDVSGGYML